MNYFARVAESCDIGDIKIFMRPEIDSNVSSFEKRLASFSRCDENSAANRRWLAFLGKYLEFSPYVLLVCSKCGAFTKIDVNLLLASTPNWAWNGITYPCPCNISMTERDHLSNFAFCWPMFTRYIDETLLNPQLKEIAKRGIIPTRFAVTKCFCCQFFVPKIDSPHSKFCIVKKFMGQVIKTSSPVCPLCGTFAVTVRALPCKHSTLCVMCLVSKETCPARLCRSGIVCIEFH